MRVLFVHSANAVNSSSDYTFVSEQAQALKKLNINVDFFGIKGHGIIGYLKNYQLLRKKIMDYKPLIIHAHYGLTGLLANIQRKIPVVTTYHGSDINLPMVRLFSKFSVLLSVHNIFVSQQILKRARVRRYYSTIPCGIDDDFFFPMESIKAREQLGFNLDDNLVLFSGSFSNKVKNYELAREAVSQINGVKLLDLKGYSRAEVVVLLNACNCLLMTSFTEGSPMIIKEAMACNCPIVSVDVADVAENISGLQNCYVTAYDGFEISEKLKIVLASKQRSNGRDRLIEMGLTNDAIGKKLVEIYNLVLTKARK